MKYKEILELYKNGQLDGAQKETVENDIDKHRALSEYLVDAEELEFSEDAILPDGPVYRSGTEDGDKIGADKSERGNDEFTKFIRKSIRNTFLRTGALIGAIVLAVVFFVLFALPKIVDNHYYNPGKIIGKSSRETNRISLDMAVYSELFLPGRYRDCVEASSNGYGKYDISIFQTHSFSGDFHTIGGVINKGKIITYDDNFFDNIAETNFLFDEKTVRDNFNVDDMQAYREETYERLDKLNELDPYMTYVSLDRVMSYDEFIRWAKENNISPDWCKLCFKKDYPGASETYAKEEDSPYYAYYNIGFIPGGSCGDLYYDEKKYPLLTQFSLSKQMKDFDSFSLTEDVMKKHVGSMLLYMAEQKDFTEMMKLPAQKDYLKNAANEIQNEGLHICGFTMVSDKETLCAIRDIPEVYYIYTARVRYE